VARLPTTKNIRDRRQRSRPAGPEHQAGSRRLRLVACPARRTCVICHAGLRLPRCSWSVMASPRKHRHHMAMPFGIAQCI